ncbi:MAG: hypothetical protein MI724_09975 [Spirochaetales bacterium]|nr:hypothetical protein [Spirochaetales bacterium]
MAAFFVVSALVFAVAFRFGLRYNARLAATVIAAVEECFRPRRTDYVALGRGIGYGFEYDLDGPIATLHGVVTTLPRYAPLYMPIARLLGRSDLLKLTFHCRDALPPGVGTLVHETAHRSHWSAVERDDEWNEERVVTEGRRFRLFSFNPLVANRLKSMVPYLASAPNINQIGLDSRCGTITIFLTPYANSIKKELEAVAATLFSLTAPETRVTVS